MASYKIDQSTGKVSPLEKYDIKSETSGMLSLQSLVADNPEFLLDIPDLNIQSSDKVIVAREYQTTSGPIDILMITKDADIIITETKLLKNSEAHRTVVAQAIDYTKAFCSEATDKLIKKLGNNTHVNKNYLDELCSDNFWLSTLQKNIMTGNFKVIILGDKIHPNVLGMVESIQSAPHLAFTISLVELDPFTSDGSIVIHPRIVSNTLEIERSVIKLQVDYDKKEIKIESEIPEKEGKGTRPKLSPEEFLSKLSNPDLRDVIEDYWKKIVEVGCDIWFGTATFSTGINLDNKRLPIHYTHYDYIPIISENARNYVGVSDELYREYKEDLKASQTIFDKCVVGNRIDIPLKELTKADMTVLLDASINLAKKLIASG